MNLRIQRLLELDSAMCVFGFGSASSPGGADGKKYLERLDYWLFDPFPAVAPSQERLVPEWQLRLFRPMTEEEELPLAIESLERASSALAGIEDRLPMLEADSDDDEIVARLKAETLSEYDGLHGSLQEADARLNRFRGDRPVHSCSESPHHESSSRLARTRPISDQAQGLYGVSGYTLLNGVPNDTGALSGYISAVAPELSFIPKQPTFNPPTVPLRKNHLRVFERLFLPAKKKKERQDERQRNAEDRYKEAYDPQYEQYLKQLGTITRMKESALRILKKRDEPADQCSLLYPWPRADYDSSRATPLRVVFPIRPFYFDEISEVELDEAKKLEAYAFRNFLFLVEENDKTPDEITLALEEELSLTDSGESKSRESIPRKVRDSVWRRDEGRCCECGAKERLEFDHIIPVSKGGANTERNIQLLCQTCNRRKSNRIG